MHFTNTNHVRWQLVSGQVFHVLVLLIDDFGQLLALDHLLVHVHGNAVAEVRVFRSISTDNFRNRRTPKTKTKQLKVLNVR